MLAREKNILNAAKAVFSQYGIKRTTMNDIAEYAQVSRQTLYNSFENKEAILKALIRLYAEDTLNALHAHCDASNDISSGLDLIFEHLAFIPFDIAYNTPHGSELLEGIGNFAADEFEAAKDAFSKTIAEMLTPHEAVLKKAGTSASSLGGLISHTTLALKYKANTRKQLESQLASFKVLILRTLD